MNSSDPFGDQLRRVLASQASAVTESRIEAIAGRDYAPRARRRVLPLLCAGAVAVAAAVTAVVVALLPALDRQSGIARAAGGPATGSLAAGNRIELLGYRLSFPASYQVGRADTNCTKDLDLSAAQTSRLVTTPAPGCPLLVTSVVRSLPSGASKYQLSEFRRVGSDGVPADPARAITVTLYLAGTGTTRATTYVPARMSNGSTVYVTLAGAPTGLDVAGSGTRPAYSLVQLSEFEQGVSVSR